MKYPLLILMSFLLYSTVNGQTPERIEIQFKLYNESDELLTCDSLKSDTLSIIEWAGQFESYSFDSISVYHSVSLLTARNSLSIHWVRNEKVMDFLFDIFDTTGIKMSHYSFDHIKFEEGQYEVRIFNNSSNRKTFLKSKSDYFHNIQVITENHIQHYTWDTLEPFMSSSADWLSFFYYPLNNGSMERLYFDN